MGIPGKTSGRTSRETSVGNPRGSMRRTTRRNPRETSGELLEDLLEKCQEKFSEDSWGSDGISLAATSRRIIEDKIQEIFLEFHLPEKLQVKLQ